MEYVYMLLMDGAEWEDMIIFLDKEEAINASIKYPRRRIAIFIKTNNGYIPTYNSNVDGTFFYDKS